jgi:diguanylate cyclase (GGDEF)-like protein
MGFPMKLLLVNNTKSFFSAISQSIQDSSVSYIISGGIVRIPEEIKINEPNMILVNWTSGEIDAVEICRKIRRIKRPRHLYIMVLASREKEKLMPAVISAGADDFIFKPFGKEELSLRIAMARNSIRKDEQVLKSKKKLMKFAKEDPVTGLLNRRALLDEGLMEMGRSKRERKFFSAIMISINNLKDIIERDGALKGNSLLLETAKILRKHCRTYDRIGRYGISNILILLPDAKVEQAESFALRYLERLEKNPVTVKDEIIDTDISIGISDLNPLYTSRDRNVDDTFMNDLLLDSLVRRTEAAMEKASERGKNMIVINSGN